jgi:flagellar motor switch/type III secretory pathway protein FliN
MSPDPATTPDATKDPSLREADPGSAIVFNQGRDRLTPGSLPAAGKWEAVAVLPLQLDVAIPIPNFRVRDLLALDKGTILESNWSHAEDIPVWCGGVQLMWAEFEVIENILAVRVTRVG